MSFDPVFDSLLIHTCTIVEAGTKDAGYGHGSTPDWDNPASTKSGVAFRLMPRDGDSRFNAELHTATSAGAKLSQWLGFMNYVDAPSGLFDKNASLKFRIVNVLDKAGNVVDAGPFDIRDVAIASGDFHHIELSLRRVS